MSDAAGYSVMIRYRVVLVLGGLTGQLLLIAAKAVGLVGWSWVAVLAPAWLFGIAHGFVTIALFMLVVWDESGNRPRGGSDGS